MHIAFLTPEFPHPKTSNSGGLGTSIKNLAAALVNNREKVSVFVYGQKSNEVIDDNGITIHLIQQKKYAFSTWFFYRKHLQNYITNQFAHDDQDRSVQQGVGHVGRRWQQRATMHERDD